MHKSAVTTAVVLLASFLFTLITGVITFACCSNNELANCPSVNNRSSGNIIFYVIDSGPKWPYQYVYFDKILHYPTYIDYYYFIDNDFNWKNCVPVIPVYSFM